MNINEILKSDYDLLCKDYKKAIKKIEKLEEEKGFKWTNLEQVFEIINKQQYRIDKAIEYIEEHELNDNKISEMLCGSEIIELLDILKGGNENEMVEITKK